MPASCSSCPCPPPRPARSPSPPTRRTGRPLPRQAAAPPRQRRGGSRRAQRGRRGRAAAGRCCTSSGCTSCGRRGGAGRAVARLEAAAAQMQSLAPRARSTSRTRRRRACRGAMLVTVSVTLMQPGRPLMLPCPHCQLRMRNRVLRCQQQQQWSLAQCQWRPCSWLACTPRARQLQHHCQQYCPQRRHHCRRHHHCCQH